MNSQFQVQGSTAGIVKSARRNSDRSSDSSVLPRSRGARWLRVITGLALLAINPGISLADTDQYYYNGSNQLVETVNDTSGRVVTYTYDANGSVVAINAVTSNALTISGFTPSSGAVGNPVTIYGTGFDPVAANNIVAINGTSTLVSSASSTTLVTSVPTGASTGPITVSNTIGSVTSASNFVVTGSGGTSGGPVATLSPYALSFTAQGVGTTSAAQTITLTNTGGADLHFSTPITYGANTNDFSITGNTCTSALIANASCTISVSFTPGATGNRSAGLVIFSDANNGSQSVTLSGLGAVSTAVVAPSALTFADQLVNTTGASQNVTVTNSGGSSLTISSVTFAGDNAGDFVVAANGCTAAVAAGASCTVGVAFRPTAMGARTGALQIASDASNGTQQVSLGGTGIAPAASMAPSSLAFGNQLLGTTSTARSLTITNSGTAPLTVGTVAIGGANPGDYAVSGNTCTSAIAVNASCTISVTFAPTATGSSAATLQVSTDAATGTQWIPLSGAGITPLISVTPSSNAFGDVLINTVSVAKTFTVTNTGSAPLTVGMLSFTGTNASDFAVSSVNCSGALSVGATCTIGVTFQPAATGPRSATLQVASNANNGTQSVSVTGTGVAPMASASPTSLSFGNQLVSTTSAASVVTISNTGTSPLTVGTPSFTGTNSADFTISANTCTGAVAVSQNCSISVTFTPGAPGSRSATLQVPSDATNGTQTVSLSGTGIVAIASVTPTTLSYGNQLINTSTGGQTVTVSNSGQSPLTVSGASLTGANASDFAITSNTCSSALNYGVNCTISVKLTPSATGSRSASLSIASNASNGTQTVGLSGTGIAPNISVSPSSVSFGNQLLNTTSTTRTLTLTNSGTAPLNVGTLTLSGANASDFSASSGCSAPIAVGANCTVTLTFTPSAVGSRSATVQIPSDATSGTQSINLTGTGTAPSISVSASSVSYGNVVLNTTSAAQTLTLTNSGTAPLTIGSLSLSGTNNGDFTISSSNCGSAVAPASSCTVGVTFTPSALGSRSAQLSIPSDATNGTQTVSMSGTGVAPSASISPASLTYGNQLVNTASAAQTIVVTNTGTSALHITSVNFSGTNSGDFSATGCTTAVAAGSSCNLNVSFMPSAMGSRSATISIVSDALNGTQSATLSGNGIAPVATLTPATADFGLVAVLFTSAPVTYTVKNTGTATMTVGTPTVTGTGAGPFFISGNYCTASLAPGQACTITMRFAPTRGGAQSATLNVPSDAINGTQTAQATDTAIGL